MDRLGWRLILLTVVLLLAACSPRPSGIEVSSAWVRANIFPVAETAAMASSPEAGSNTGAFLMITNHTSADERLVEVRSNAAGSVEIHESVMENQVMKMRHLENGLVIPAGQSVELKPGGYHIMLIGLNQELTAGGQVDLVLVFEKAGEVQITAEVKAP